jgi:hypothetical protein
LFFYGSKHRTPGCLNKLRRLESKHRPPLCIHKVYWPNGPMRGGGGQGHMVPNISLIATTM